MSDIESMLLIAAVLMLASVLASKASSRFGVPSLLLFLVIGMLAGSEGPGQIWFNDVAMSQHIGIVALAFILFSGGLDTPWRDVRRVLLPGLSMATIGVVVSAGVAGWFAHVLFRFTPLESLLLGVIISSTDAAAVFAVLRTSGVRLRGKLQPLIELESGSNDPMAIFLTTTLIGLVLKPTTSLPSLAGEFAMEMGIGAAAGMLAGRGSLWLINRIQLDHSGLYPVLSVALVLLTYAGSALIHGNGFLAVYVAGIVIGNNRFIHRATIVRFHDAIAWIMQIAMFLALGLLVFPSRLLQVAGQGVALALILTFVARPLSMFVALAATPFNMREKLLLSWCGLRGAVPIILATFPLIAGLPAGGTMFNIVFFTVIVSVMLQGTTIPWLARRLGLVDQPLNLDPLLPDRRESDLVTIALAERAPAIGRQLVELGLPLETIVLLVYREHGFFAPTGGTMFRTGDRLMVLTSKRSVDEVRDIVAGPAAGSDGTA